MTKWLRSGLELQLIALQNILDDPMNEEMRACIVCFELASACSCGEAQIIWDITYAIKLLQSTIGELVDD